MTIAILCPGPSLPKYGGKGDIRIGVNRAAIAYRCDHWAALDYTMVRDNRDKVLGTPKLWTDKQQAERFGGTYCRTALKCDADCNWSCFSMFIAMVLAAHLGATHIDLWGCDWNGTKDYDGREAGEMRDESRWTRERLGYGKLAAWLAGKGIGITRH